MLAGLTALLGGGNGGGGAAFESIATLAGSGTSVTFSSIPSTYKHLQIRYIYREGNASSGNQNLGLQLNADASASYAYHYLYGDGSAASAGGSSAQTSIVLLGAGPGNNATASVFGAGVIDIHDYSSTSKAKTVRSFHGCDLNTASTNWTAELASGLWTSTAAVSSIKVLAASASGFASGTTFALYGVKG